MQYMLLIYGAEADEPSDPAVMEEYMALSRDLRERGRLLGGDELQPVATATTVRVKQGRVLTTDGPFAETREQLGGYFLVEADDLDEAIAIAARIPATRYGSVEVRPVVMRG